MSRIASASIRFSLPSNEHLDDFIKRWKHAFNEELTRDEAQAKASELLELYRMLSRRPPGEEGSAPPAEQGR